MPRSDELLLNRSKKITPAVHSMPWPDFSELSFGFAFLREFERNNVSGRSFPSAPDFISQNAEATKGYDVAVLDGSTPVFFQFKRSFVLTTANAKEFKNGDFGTLPFFRMHLRQKNAYRQHIALQELEQAGNIVFYVTSQIQSFEDLTRAYVSQSVLDETAALFSPIEIALPDLYQPHHLCFEANGIVAEIYSEQGHRFSRKYPNRHVAVELALLPQRRSAEANRKALANIANQLSAISSPVREFAERFKDPVIKASVLAFLILDAQLSFFKPK